MKLSRFLSIISCVTFFSLVYVYQQTEILRLAYAGQKKIVYLEDLLDKNSILRYNINKSTSLVFVGNSISKYVDYEMPDSYRLVRLTGTGSKESLRAGAQVVKKENLLSRLFGIKRQAEAKTTNP